MARSFLTAKEQQRALEVAHKMLQRERPVSEFIGHGVLGRVRRWNVDRAFGFIEIHYSEDIQIESWIFCHASECDVALQEEDVVVFDIVRGQSGFQAERVRRCKRSTVLKDQMGHFQRWFPRPLIMDSDGNMIRCSEDDFCDTKIYPNDPVVFDLEKDVWTGKSRVARRVRPSDSETIEAFELSGRIVRWTGSFGFVSTDIYEKDLYFHLEDTIMDKDIRVGKRVVFDVTTRGAWKWLVNVRSVSLDNFSNSKQQPKPELKTSKNTVPLTKENVQKLSSKSAVEDVDTALPSQVSPSATDAASSVTSQRRTGV